jgi:MOSC domain-containing protein YiiM
MEALWNDPAAYNDQDLARTIGQLDAFVNQAMSADGRGLSDFAPPPAVREAIDSALVELGESSVGGFSAVCTRLAASAGNTQWRRMADGVLLVAVRELSAYTAGRREARNETLTGQIVGLHSSQGGVPKSAVQSAKVGIRGIEGDVQRSRQHHGRPWQALCLWADEAILRLQGERHPIARGSAGENITVSGIDWTEATCGSLLICGDLVAELTLFSLPCSKNAKWFLNGDFNRMHHAAEPGISRMYASVLRPGAVSLGDRVTLQLR